MQRAMSRFERFDAADLSMNRAMDTAEAEFR